MNFSDKLQKIRKENNITQEGLADRLNVSRQAVSKWESGLAYPDTEKLIQISKIFNVSLDELINDNVDTNKGVGGSNKKIDFMGILNEILGFISKSVNMFWSMKFTEKIKCLFEMMVLILIIVGVSMISTSILVSIIRRIFIFIPGDFMYYICNIFETLLFLAWLVLGIIIIIKIFKSRYLDYYMFVVDDSVNEKVIEEPIRELKEKREYKVVIRDPKDSSLNIFKKLGKICIFFVKCFGFILVIPLVLLFILCIMILVFSLFYILDGLFFNGISISLVGILLFIYLMMEFIYNLLFNRDHLVNRIFILFVISISLVGIGLGLSFVSLSNFNYEEEKVNEVNTHMIDMNDDLVLEFMMYHSNNIVIDNSLDKIKIEVTSYGNRDVYLYSYNSYTSDGDIYLVYDLDYDYNEIEFYRDVINNLKDRRIVNSNEMAYDVKIYISEDNLTKLKRNINDFNGYIVFYE